ncbi:MAG: hypothetical protein ACOY82_14240 [Pseudomonadota bacterium]
MTCRNTTIVVLVAALAAFLAGRHFGIQANAQASEDARVAIRSDRHSIAYLPTPTASIPRPVAPRPRIDPALRAQLFEEYRCPQESCAPSPFVAENSDEAAWMRARGYPSRKQQEEADRASTAELKAKAATGDLVAASLYGQRQIEENDWKGAQATLLRTIQRGNIFALYTLAYWEGNHPQHPDPVQARTMIRLAYLAGDYKSTEVLVQTFPKFTSPVEQAMVDRHAAHYYRNMLRFRTYPRPPSSN